MSLNLINRDASNSSWSIFSFESDLHNFSKEKTLSTEADDGTHSEINWNNFPQEWKTLKTDTPSSCLCLLLLSRHHSKMAKALWLVFPTSIFSTSHPCGKMPSGRTSQPSSSYLTRASSCLFILRWMILLGWLFFLRMFSFIMILETLMFMFGKLLWFFANASTCDTSFLASSINSWDTKAKLLKLCRCMWNSAILMSFSCVGSKTEAPLNTFVAVRPLFIWR